VSVHDPIPVLTRHSLWHQWDVVPLRSWDCSVAVAHVPSGVYVG